MYEKHLKDNVWGEIFIKSKVALMFIDTVEFQRLDDIHQTGASYKVFPTAVNMRKEHSFGTYHLTGILLENIERTQNMNIENKELIKIAGLLHDIGHGPFSHTLDEYLNLENNTWNQHEYRSIDIVRFMKNKYKIPLSDNELDFICECINPSTVDWQYNVVSNSINGIDTDKLDYIVRDNKANGLHLNIDVERIINNIRIIDNTMCFDERIKDEIFNLFYVRYRLYRDIYCHPKIIGFELFIKDMMKTTNINKIIEEHNIEEYCKWTDSYMLHAVPLYMKEKFMMRKVYHHIKNPAYFDKCIKVAVPIGFVGKNKDPFRNIILYNRYTYNTYPVEPKNINMLLQGQYNVHETIEYYFSIDEQLLI